MAGCRAGTLAWSSRPARGLRVVARRGVAARAAPSPVRTAQAAQNVGFKSRLTQKRRTGSGWKASTSPSTARGVLRSVGADRRVAPGVAHAQVDGQRCRDDRGEVVVEPALVADRLEPERDRFRG